MNKKDVFDEIMMKGSQKPKGKAVAEKAEESAKGKEKGKTVTCPKCGEEIEV